MARPKKQTAAQRRASLKNLAKARRARLGKVKPAKRKRKVRRNPPVVSYHKKAATPSEQYEAKKKAAAKRRRAAKRRAAAKATIKTKSPAKKRPAKRSGTTMAKRKKSTKVKRTKKTKARRRGKKLTKAQRRVIAIRNLKKAHAKNRKGSKRKARKGGKIRRIRVGQRVSIKPTKRTKARRYQVKRSRRGRITLRRVRKNPMTAIKGMLKTGALMFGGLVGMRVINNLLKTYVTSKFSASLPAQIVPILPAGLGFVAAAFADKVIKGKPALVNAIQMGATVALLDAVLKTFVIPRLPTNVQGMLAGVDDMGVMGYGYGYPTLGEYVSQPQMQLGAPAYEAMAGLDEYVSDGGVGAFDVSEALADSEVQSMQRGYAGGSLAKTVFSS